MRISDWSSDVCSSDLSDALVRDLTAHRTLALRLELGDQPVVALIALTHALASQTFYHAADDQSCLEVHMTASPLTHHAEGIGETAAAKALEERHRAWAERVPRNSDELWDFEIGRATCRERVCQYVEISVVAGPLKKKKKN